MTVLTLASGEHTAQVDLAHGGRVASLEVRGTELVCGADANRAPFLWGIYPMVPFAGRLRNGRIFFRDTTEQFPLNAPPHAMHGFTHDVEWRIHERTDSAVVMRMELGDPWPWRAVLFHTVSLHGWKLRMDMSVTAREEQPMMIGWHPWFARPCATALEFGAMYERGDDHLPTGRLVRPVTENVDDCFADPVSDPVVTVGDVRTTLHSDCSHWVVFDGMDHGVCVEPQSGPPNAANDSPTVLRAGGEMRRWFEIRW
ncbi:MAG: aldose 1-epimerase [Acidimicrobiales bacterium]